LQSTEGRHADQVVLFCTRKELSTHLRQAYELHTAWEKARAVYTVLLTYTQDASQPVMESTALIHLAILAAWRRYSRRCDGLPK
jgi:hypothetical protein